MCNNKEEVKERTSLDLSHLFVAQKLGRDSIDRKAGTHCSVCPSKVFRAQWSTIWYLISLGFKILALFPQCRQIEPWLLNCPTHIWAEIAWNMANWRKELRFSLKFFFIKFQKLCVVKISHSRQYRNFTCAEQNQ